MTPEQLDKIQAPLPADARMDAYYYGFERTGVGCIDAILSAVAIAGKGSHHTQSWGEDSEFDYYKNRPGLPDAANAVELIQEAAAQASVGVTALLAIVREQQAQIERVRELHQPFTHHFLSPPAGSLQVCHSCHESYPCPTIAALTATEGQA